MPWCVYLHDFWCWCLGRIKRCRHFCRLWSSRSHWNFVINDNWLFKTIPCSTSLLLEDSQAVIYRLCCSRRRLAQREYFLKNILPWDSHWSSGEILISSHWSLSWRRGDRNCSLGTSSIFSNKLVYLHVAVNKEVVKPRDWDKVVIEFSERDDVSEDLDFGGSMVRWHVV